MDAKKSGTSDTHQSDPGQVDMIYHKLLLSITFIAFFLVQANAQTGDPLDPNQLGESMSMPMSQELIQEARNAGVITESNPLSESDSKQPGLSVAPQPEAGADNSLNNVNVNVTGAWSFDLKGKALEQMKLYLIQNKDVVIGQGVINRENETENATASGSISGEKMSLTVMPVGVSNLYKLNLSLSSMDGGTYNAYMADGSSRSGQVTYTVSSNIFKPASTIAKDGPVAYATAGSAAATPVQLSGAQGPSGSTSSTVSSSMSSGGGSMSKESSSSSFSGSVV
jgi:hypothetical protein